jgi:hypothetical protein
MNRSTFVALGLTGALALVSAPAFAQHSRDGGGRSRDNAAPRTESRRQSQAQPQSQPQQRQQEQRAAPRQEQRAVPRQQYSAPRYDNRGYYNAGRSYSGRYYGPRYAGPRFSIAPRRFYRPYYAFRPRFSIGFGIWAGYPVSYYDPYYYPYDYYPYASAAPGYPPQGPGYYPPQGSGYPPQGSGYPPQGPGYQPQGSVGVRPGAQPNQANMGGLSFDISPDTAEVYVDGSYVGQVSQFTASSQPIGLPAGRHHVELREPGYQVSSFDVDIVAGQVIPSQGQLEQ